MPPRTLRVDNPFSGEICAELTVDDLGVAVAALQRCAAIQREWAQSQIAERSALLVRFADAFRANREQVASEITQTMGKPLAQALGEVNTLADRAYQLAALAPEALAEETLPGKQGFDRSVTREPVGVVLDIAPWNYPLLTAVNAVAAAVLAGNGVILKHSSRTPLCGPQFERAFLEAGAPKGLVRSLTLDHDACGKLIECPEIGFVAFTGSVDGGRSIQASAARRFIGVGLELGGKDAAYVASDANLDHAAANLADGAFYNAGQSCCGIKRIFVAEQHYQTFLEALVAHARNYRLGDPADAQTTLGPLATPDAPGLLAEQTSAARASGGRLLCGGGARKVDGRGRFFDATVVADVPPGAALMREESFGPLVAVATVRDDAEAIARINDSPFGLTAAIWSADAARARRIGRQLAVGTVFMNRCDYLDPMLPWVGVKDSGRGISLSRWGIQELTRPKSYHFRLATS